MKNSTTAKGSPAVIEAVCRAASPPTSSSTAATAPSRIAQKSRDCHSGSGSPPLVSISTTKDPESEDVAKNSTTTTIATTEDGEPDGRCPHRCEQHASDELPEGASSGDPSDEHPDERGPGDPPSP